VYGDNLKTAAGGGSFVHSHESMVLVVEIDPKRNFSSKEAKILSVERLTQKDRPDMNIKPRVIGGNNITLDFKALCCTRITYTHSKGIFQKEKKYDRNRFPEATD
jgi:hypothetical protein